MGACPLGGRYKSWTARCVDKLLPRRYLQAGFIVGVKLGGEGEESTHQLFWGPEDHSQHLDGGN